MCSPHLARSRVEQATPNDVCPRRARQRAHRPIIWRLSRRGREIMPFAWTNSSCTWQKPDKPVQIAYKGAVQIVQALMGVLVVLSLLYKRHREKPKRPWKIWYGTSNNALSDSVLIFLISGCSTSRSKSQDRRSFMESTCSSRTSRPTTLQRILVLCTFLIS